MTDTSPLTQVPFFRIVRTRSFLIAGLAYFVVLLLLFWPLLKGYYLTSAAATSLQWPFEMPDRTEIVPYVSIWTNDFVQQFSEFDEYQYRAAREGRFPTWNPHILLGHPFHADGQSAMLFPSHWIYFLVDPNIARGPMAIVRLWISAMALFCLLRKFHLSPTASFAGGAIWTFSSFNMHWLFWPHTNASLWMPVVLLALDYLFIKPSWRGYAIASLATAPLFLAGHPGTEYLGGHLLAVYFAVRLIGLFREGVAIRRLLIATVAVAAAVFTGILVASAALLPLFMQLRNSYEYLDVKGHRITTTDLPWDALWLFLMPEYYGRPRGYYPGFVYDGPDNYIEITMWFGAVAFVLALAGMASTLVRLRQPGGRRRETFSPLLAFGIVAFFLSLLIGFRIWPVYQIFSHLPGAQLTRMRRFFLTTNFAGAVLAACALHQILEQKNRALASFASAFAVASCILVGNNIWTSWDQQKRNWTTSIQATADTWGPHWSHLLRPMAEQFAGNRMIAGAVVLFVGTALLLWITALIYRRRKASALPPLSPLLGFILTAIITLDVLLPGYDLNPIAPRQLVVPPVPKVLQSLIQQTGDSRMAGAGWVLVPNISMHFGYRDIRGYDFPHNQRLSQLFERLDLSEYDNHSELELNRLYPTIDPQLAVYLNRICLRTLVVPESDPKIIDAITSLKPRKDRETPGLLDWPKTASPGNGVMIFTNPNAYPRVFFASTARLASSATDAMDALLDNTTDLRDRSVYEGVHAAAISSANNPSPGDSVAIITDKPEQVAIDCTAAVEHFLVLEDRMDDGWKVRIDGLPTDALTANYLFRGVFVPAGHHIVEWTYYAPGLAAGFTISAITVSGMILLLIVTGFRGRNL